MILWCARALSQYFSSLRARSPTIYRGVMVAYTDPHTVVQKMCLCVKRSAVTRRVKEWPSGDKDNHNYFGD